MTLQKLKNTTDLLVIKEAIDRATLDLTGRGAENTDYLRKAWLLVRKMSERMAELEHEQFEREMEPPEVLGEIDSFEGGGYQPLKKPDGKIKPPHLKNCKKP